MSQRMLNIFLAAGTASLKYGVGISKHQKLYKNASNDKLNCRKHALHAEAIRVYHNSQSCRWPTFCYTKTWRTWFSMWVVVVASAEFE